MAAPAPLPASCSLPSILSRLAAAVGKSEQADRSAILLLLLNDLASPAQVSSSARALFEGIASQQSFSGPGSHPAWEIFERLWGDPLFASIFALLSFPWLGQLLKHGRLLSGRGEAAVEEESPPVQRFSGFTCSCFSLLITGAHALSVLDAAGPAGSCSYRPLYLHLLNACLLSREELHRELHIEVEGPSSCCCHMRHGSRDRAERRPVPAGAPLSSAEAPLSSASTALRPRTPAGLLSAPVAAASTAHVLRFPAEERLPPRLRDKLREYLLCCTPFYLCPSSWATTMLRLPDAHADSSEVALAMRAAAAESGIPSQEGEGKEALPLSGAAPHSPASLRGRAAATAGAAVAADLAGILSDFTAAQEAEEELRGSSEKEQKDVLAAAVRGDSSSSSSASTGRAVAAPSSAPSDPTAPCCLLWLPTDSVEVENEGRRAGVAVPAGPCSFPASASPAALSSSQTAAPCPVCLAHSRALLLSLLHLPKASPLRLRFARNIAAFVQRQRRYLLQLRSEQALLKGLAALSHGMACLPLDLHSRGRLQALLVSLSTPGGPFYPTPPVRTAARAAADALFGEGKRVRRLVQACCQLLHPLQWPDSVLRWSRDRLCSCCSRCAGRGNQQGVGSSGGAGEAASAPLPVPQPSLLWTAASAVAACLSKCLPAPLLAAAVSWMPAAAGQLFVREGLGQSERGHVSDGSAGSENATPPLSDRGLGRLVRLPSSPYPTASLRQESSSSSAGAVAGKKKE